MVADLCENFNFGIEHFNIEYYRHIHAILQQLITIKS